MESLGAAVKDLPTGALVGYGGMYRTTQPSRIAVLAAGYLTAIPTGYEQGASDCEGPLGALNARGVEWI